MRQSEVNVFLAVSAHKEGRNVNCLSVALVNRAR